MFKISKGIISSPVRAVIYGPEGVGKSTLATWAPKPLFLDLEKGTKNLEVDRIEYSPEEHWGLITKNYLEEIAKATDFPYRSLVIDSIDSVQESISQYICSNANKQSIEDFGYGKGYTHLAEAFTQLLDLLDRIVERGIHVILIGHSVTKKHEDPGQVGSYDRFELNAEKKISPIVKEWADLLGFMTYKSTLTDGDKGKVAVGGKERVIYLEHNAAWDAKNRYNLPAEVPAEWSSLAPAFNFEYTAPNTKPQIQLGPEPGVQDKAEDKVQDSEPEEETVVDPLTETDESDNATPVQQENIKSLWKKCTKDLDFKATHMKQLWKFYKLEGPAGTWSKLTKPQAAKVISFLTSKLEAGPDESAA